MTPEEKAKKEAEKKAAAEKKAEAKRAKAERKAKLEAMTPEEKEKFLAEEKAEKLEEFAKKEQEHSEKNTAKKKDLDANGTKWNKFWFNFSQWGIWQAIRRGWSKFSCLHPVLSDWIWKIFFFIVFSEGVTIWQFLVMTFLPYAFKDMWTTPFVWPAVALPWKDAAGTALNWAIFNEPVKYLAMIGGKEKSLLAFSQADIDNILATYPEAKLQCAGLGNFIAFEIAVFTAQCINFPLQRNITYKSHGNPWWQAMWYFIGWVLISILVNACWGIVNPLLMMWNWNEAIIGLIKTVITGGLSMVVFFFIFMIIFPSDKKKEN